MQMQADNSRVKTGKIGEDAPPSTDSIRRMKNTAFSLVAFVLTLAAAAETPKSSADRVCPIDGKPADSKYTSEYEGRSYAACSEACLTKWKGDREASLYQQIGGKAAIDAAVNLFYVKVLADPRIKDFFADVDMVRQHTKQKAFISAALGSPVKYEGRDMRRAHAKLPGLNDSHFNAVAEHLQATLAELKVKKELIDKVLAVVETTRADVLNRAK